MRSHERDHLDSEQAVTRNWFLKSIFILFCIETLFSLPYRSIYLLRQSTYQAWMGACCVLVLIGICFALRQSILTLFGKSFRALSSVSRRTWLSFWLVVGLALRLAWILLFPVTLKADNLAYFQIAAKLAQGDTNTGIFWPPGFSLALTPWFAVLGAHLWVSELCALIFFVATYLLTYVLANQMQSGLVSRIAPMLIAIWPGYFTLAGINIKEGFLAVLVPATLLFYLKASGAPSALDPALNASTSAPPGTRTPFRWGSLIAAGLCMGLAALTQPGYILFPAVILCSEWLRNKSPLRAIGRTAIFSIALVAAILPWTSRNYLTYHHLVLISANGGSVFYRANNPLANANYSEEGELPLPKDVFAADKLGYQLAEDWISHHPAAFAELMVRKQIVFLGDDALGAYETLKRDLNPSSLLYASIKGISNLFWLAAWTVLLLGSSLLFRNPGWRLWYGVLFLPLVYQWAIDSVFESGPRHHVPYVAPIAVLIGIVINLASRQETDSSQRPSSATAETRN